MASTQPPPLNRRSSSISSQALDVLAILETDVTAFETGQAKAEQVLQNVGPNPDGELKGRREMGLPAKYRSEDRGLGLEKKGGHIRGAAHTHV